MTDTTNKPRHINDVIHQEVLDRVKPYEFSVEQLSKRIDLIENNQVALWKAVEAIRGVLSDLESNNVRDDHPDEYA